jgi:magnesium-transporting ATPase (P-type)
MEQDDQMATQSSDNISIGDMLPSAAVVGLIFSIITFAIGLAVGYYEISSEPSGAIFSPSMLSGTVICLVSLLAGALAVWHFVKEVNPFIKLGQGAALGFLTGAIIVILSALYSEIWSFIDPDYTEKLVEATIANIEAMDMPDQQRDQMIDGMAGSIREQSSIASQLLWGIPITGLINLLSGMVGVKIFAKKEDQETF